jgi:hypothetical protein
MRTVIIITLVDVEHKHGILKIETYYSNCTILTASIDVATKHKIHRKMRLYHRVWSDIEDWVIETNRYFYPTGSQLRILKKYGIKF